MTDSFPCRQTTRTIGNLVESLLDQSHVLSRDMDLIELLGFDRFFQLTKAPLIIIVIDAFDDMRTHPLPIICNGCRIRDIRGAVHTVQSVSEQEGLTVLYLRDGDAAYFERLFRDIFVDATLFTLLPEEA